MTWANKQYVIDCHDCIEGRNEFASMKQKFVRGEGSLDTNTAKDGFTAMISSRKPTRSILSF